MTDILEENGPYVPITADLEYEDGEYRQHSIAALDISAHLLATFPTIDEIVEAWEKQTVESIMGGVFEEDPMILDDHGNQRPFYMPTFDLHASLRAALADINPDHDADIGEMWAIWSHRAQIARVADRKRREELDYAIDAFKSTVETHAVIQQHDGLTAAFSVLIAMEGGLAAAREALRAYAGPDSVGALRALSAIPA